MNFADHIRTIPDYPKPGIMFRDITTLLGNATAFAAAIEALAAPFTDAGVSKVAGIEARGFILGGAVAHRLGAGFAPIRKSGKLPWRTRGQAYALEYGTDTLEIHEDAVAAGERVLIIDDLIATGGTVLAAANLVRSLGAHIIGAAFVIDLPDLGGMAELRTHGLETRALCAFGGH